MSELILNTGEFIDHSESVHDVIFNRLDLIHSNNGKEFKYDAEEFRKALPLFKETLLVFADTHPQNIGKLPLEDALKEVDGRLVGTPQDVLVNNTGTLFRGSVNISDSEVNELVKTGKAMLSTAFSATPDEDGVLRNIIPNHILVYPSATGISPGDHAALFLNQSEKNGHDIMTEDIKTDTMEFAKSLIQNQTVIQNQTAKISEQVTQISEQKELILNQKNEIEGLKSTVEQKDKILTEKETLITNQASDIEALKGKVVELSTQIDNINIATKNARRERIFNQYAPGIRKAFESRKEEIFDDGKYEELIFEMNQSQCGLKQPPTEASGVEDVTNQSEIVSNGVSVEKDPVTGQLVAKVITRGA
jgi:hypothetical protein